MVHAAYVPCTPGDPDVETVIAFGSKPGAFRDLAAAGVSEAGDAQIVTKNIVKPSKLVSRSPLA